MYALVCVYACLHAPVCVRACARACMSMCVCVCVCVCRARIDHLSCVSALSNFRTSPKMCPKSSLPLAYHFPYWTICRSVVYLFPTTTMRAPPRHRMVMVLTGGAAVVGCGVIAHRMRHDLLPPSPPPILSPDGPLVACNDEAHALFGHLPCYRRHLRENATITHDVARSDAALADLIAMLPAAALPPEALAAARAMRGWPDYFEDVRPRFRRLRQDCGCLYPNSRVLTDYLSRPLTAYAALQRLGIARRRLDLHVVGASRAETLQAPRLFAELAHLLPDTDLHVALVGPDVTPPADAGCDAGAPAQVHLQYLPGPYHEVAPRRRPDLVVIYHSGLHLYPEWGATLQALIRQRVPTVITAFNETDMRRNYEFLTGAGGGPVPRPHVVFGPEVNPFHSLSYVPPVVSNAYWLAFQGPARS